MPQSSESAPGAPVRGTAAPDGPRRLLQRAASVLGTQAVAAALGVASLPVLAQRLGPEGYGRLSLFLTLLGVVTYQDFLRPLLVRALARDPRPQEAERDLSLVVGWTLSLAGLAIGAALLDAATAPILAVAVLAHALASVDFARLSLDGRAAFAAGVRNLALGSAAVTAAAVACLPGAGAGACCVPFAVANLAVLAIYRRATCARGGLLPDLARARAAWSAHRGAIASLVGFGLANALVVSADRILVEVLADARTFGLYAGCADLASKLAVVGSSLGVVLYPSFAREVGDGAGGPLGARHAAQRFVAVASGVLVGWAAFIALLVACSGPIVALLLGAEFEAASGCYALLLGAAFVQMLGFLITPWQRARGEFATQTRAYLGAGLAMIAVGLAAIPPLGLLGAALCACTARTAELALLARELRVLPAGALGRRRLAALGASAAVVLALVAWRASEGA